MPPPLDSLRISHLTTNIAYFAVLLSSLVWGLLFFLSYVVAKGNKFVSSCLIIFVRLLHGLGVIIFAYSAVTEHPYPFLESGEDNNVLHNFVLVFSLGFFIVEFLHNLITGSESKVMQVHHVSSVVSIATFLIAQNGGAEMMVAMFFMECTNPLFQFRGILRLTRYKDGVFYMIVEWVFVTLFVLVRVLFCGIIMVLALIDPQMGLHVQIIFPLFYTLCLIMVYHTVIYAIKKYFYKEKSL